MSRIIELCGAPGAGKSTIYSALISNWKKEYNWVPGHFLYPLTKIRKNNFKIFGKSLLDKIFNIPDSAVMKQAGEKFVMENPVFVEAVWNNIYYRNKENMNSGNLRFHAADYWFQIFQKIQVLRNSENKKYALIDEGLIQRIDSALYKSETIEQEKDEIHELLQIMTLPDALIYIETDVKENILRLRSRKKKLKIHVNLPDQDLTDLIVKYQQRWQFVCENLKNQKIPVLKIDGTLSIETNSHLILQFLKGISLNKID